MWVWIAETEDRISAENWADEVILGRRPPWWRRVVAAVLRRLVVALHLDEEEFPF